MNNLILTPQRTGLECGMSMNTSNNTLIFTHTVAPKIENFGSVWFVFPRSKNRKTSYLSSPPPTDTSKLQLFTEQLLMRETGKLVAKLF